MCTVVNRNNKWDLSELHGVNLCEGSGMQRSEAPESDIVGTFPVFLKLLDWNWCHLGNIGSVSLFLFVD